MIFNKYNKLVTFTFFILILFSSTIVTESYPSNQEKQDKVANVQSKSIEWSLNLTYSILTYPIDNLSSRVFLDVNSSLKFFQNVTFAPFFAPPVVFSIYNSTDNLIYDPNPIGITVANETFIANETYDPGYSVTLDSTLIPRTDNYKIFVNYDLLGTEYTNRFSATVTNDSINIKFQNNVTTDSGIYVVPTSVTSSNSSLSNFSSNSATKSFSLPMNFHWFLLALFPLIIFSKRRKKTTK